MKQLNSLRIKKKMADVCNCKEDGQIVYITENGEVECSICKGTIKVEFK